MHEGGGRWVGSNKLVELKKKNKRNIPLAWNSAQCYVAAWLGGEFWGRMDTCICMAASVCCLPETITNACISQYKIKSLKS